MQFGQKFGALIRREREDRGLTQKDVLDLVAKIYPDAPLSTAHLSSIERGKFSNTRAKTVKMFKTALDLSDEDIEACRPTLEKTDIQKIADRSDALGSDAVGRIAKQVERRSGLRRSTFEQLNEAIASVDSLERALLAMNASGDTGISRIDLSVQEAIKSAALADAAGALKILGSANSMLTEAGTDFDQRRASVKEARANLYLSQGLFSKAAKEFISAAALISLSDEDTAANKQHEFACIMYRDSRSKGTEAAQHALSLFEANRPYCANHEERKHWASGEIDRSSCLIEIACRSPGSHSLECLNEAVANLREVIDDAQFESMSFEVKGYAANSLGLALMDLADRQSEEYARASAVEAYQVFKQFRPLFAGKMYEADFLTHMAKACRRVSFFEPLFASSGLEEAEDLLIESSELATKSSDRMSCAFVEMERLLLMGQILTQKGATVEDRTMEQYLRAGQSAIQTCETCFDAANDPIDFGLFKARTAKFFLGCATTQDPMRFDTFLQSAQEAAASALGAFEVSYSPIEWARSKFTLGQVSALASQRHASNRDKHFKTAVHFNDAKEVFAKMGCTSEAILASEQFEKQKLLI